jgi:hypothetical protein
VGHGLIKLFRTNVDHNLKVYDTENILGIDTEKEEIVNLDIDNGADGNMAKSKCC